MKELLRKVRFLIWFFKAFVIKHGKLIFSGFIAGFLLFLLFIKVYPVLIPEFKVKPKIIAVVGSYTPTTLPLYIQNLISLGLTTADSSGQAVPSLASKWDIKDDGKTYIFYFKKGLIWHDNTKFKSSDVNYNLKDVKFESITDDILKIELKEPFSPLPTILSRPIFKKGLIGIGPYKVSRVIFKENKINVLNLDPLTDDLPSLTFKFYPTESDAITAFKLGEVNTLDKLDDVSDFSSWPNVSVNSHVYNNYNILLFLNTRLPILQDRTMRQALAYGLPPINEATSSSPINPDSWAFNPNVKEFLPNVDQAKSMIDKENLGTRSATLTISTFSSFLPLAQKIADSWSNLGLTIKVKIENTVPSNFDVLLVSQEIPADPDQYQLWHSTQTTNLTGFGSPKIDKLLEDGRKINDKEKRKEIYLDFQRYLVEETPAIFLYHPKLYTVERK